VCLSPRWFLALCLATASSRADDRFERVLPLVPDSANHLVLIDVRGLHRSPLGVRQRWAQRHPAAFREGAVPFHPLAQAILLAAHYERDFHTKTWEIGLAPWARILTIQELRQAQGILETVAGQSVVLTPRNAYVFVLDARIGGEQFPANRQELARFLRSAREKRSVTLTNFLRDAAAEMGKDTQLLVAVDMADTVDAQLVRRGLEQSKVLAGQQIDLDGLAELLAGVKGMVLRLRVTDTIQGEFRIEFTDSVKRYESALRTVLLAALKQMDDDLEGLQTWQMTPEDKTVRFAKELGENELNAILVKIQPGSALASRSEAEAALDQTARATAARTYFETVTGIVADLRRRTRSVSNHRSAAQWHATAADRIDRLPIFGVDEDLQEFGASVSYQLRLLSESLSGVPIQLWALDAKKEVRVGIQPGAAAFVPGRFFGGIARPGFAYRPPIFYYQGNLAEVQGRQAQVIADDEKNRLSVWRKYDEQTAQMRRTLSARFMMDF
jgi:hypothetical protein